MNTNRENRPCSLCEKDFKFTQPMREYCQHCSIDARRIASKTYRIFDRDWFSIDGRMDGAASAASASSAASKVLIARLCIEDELKRQHRPPSPLPSPHRDESRPGEPVDMVQDFAPVPTPHLEWVKRSTASICCGTRPPFYSVHQDKSKVE